MKKGPGMKKKILIAFMVLVIASPCYAANIIDNFIYKVDVMKSNKKKVMVNRFTGEIKSVWRDDGKWVELTGQWKENYQKMYNAQKGIKR